MLTSRSHILRKNKPVLLGWTALRLCLNNLVSVVFSKKKKNCIKTATSKCQGPLHMQLPTDIKSHQQGKHYWSLSGFHCKSQVITNIEVPHINHGGKIHLLGLLKKTRCYGPEFEVDGDVDCTVLGAEDRGLLNLGAVLTGRHVHLLIEVSCKGPRGQRAWHYQGRDHLRHDAGGGPTYCSQERRAGSSPLEGGRTSCPPPTLNPVHSLSVCRVQTLYLTPSPLLCVPPPSLAWVSLSCPGQSLPYSSAKMPTLYCLQPVQFPEHATPSLAGTLFISVPSVFLLSTDHGLLSISNKFPLIS